MLGIIYSTITLIITMLAYSIPNHKFNTGLVEFRQAALKQINIIGFLYCVFSIAYVTVLLIYMEVLYSICYICSMLCCTVE